MSSPGKSSCRSSRYTWRGEGEGEGWGEDEGEGEGCHIVQGSMWLGARLGWQVRGSRWLGVRLDWQVRILLGES